MLNDVSVLKPMVIAEHHTNHAKDGSEYKIKEIVRVVAKRSNTVRF